MKVEFSVQKSSSPLEGTLLYVRDEHSFSFCRASSHSCPINEMPTTSLLLGTLQIEVTVDTGRILYVWGYSPMSSWTNGSIEPPDSSAGEVTILSAEPLIGGVSLLYQSSKGWASLYDRQNGWVLIQQEISTDAKAEEWIEVARGVVLAFKGQTLLSVFLKPRFVDKYPDALIP